jgi:putative peptidoglycan lipid II flippase
VAVLVNLALNLTLIWPLGEVGLALSTASAAALQVALLATTFSRAVGRLLWRELATTLGKSALAAAVMVAVVVGARSIDFFQVDGDFRRLAAQLMLEVAAGAAAYLAMASLLRMPEINLVFRRPRPKVAGG